MPAPKTVDAADEAGGEVVYSSEAVPLPRPRPPPIRQSAATLEVDGIDTTPAHDVFEVFAGKLYTSLQKSAKLPSSETPLERLNRLQKEVAELEADVKGSENDKILLESVNKLSEKLSRPDLLSGKSSKAETGVGTPSQDETNGKNVDSITSRLQKLEAAVGSATSSKDNQSLLQRLRDAESKVALMDDKNVDALLKKAKVLRHDLEAASKARQKLSATNKADDTKTISELHDQMVQLQGFSEHLPAIANRLSVLAVQHRDASTQQTRLKTVQETIQALSSQAGMMESALQQMEENLKETTSSLDSNLQKLEDRLATIEK